MSLSISLCMIVKNEERCISRCLKSVSSLVDEMIIVDTGSTDLTKDIILKFKREHRQIDVKLFDFEWIDDFSAARNYSLSHATKDYILKLDADEYFLSNQAKELKRVLKFYQLKKNVIPFFGLRQFNKNRDDYYYNYCLWSNQKDVYFSRRIHESVMDSIKDLNYELVNLSVSFNHDGYVHDSYESLQRKVNRNIRLLSLCLEENPTDYLSMYYFARDYGLTNIHEGLRLLYSLVHVVKDDYVLSKCYDSIKEYETLLEDDSKVLTRTIVIR